MTNPVPEHPLVELTRAQINLLLQDLDPNRIQILAKAGSKASYLAAWDVRATLTRIFGFGGWSGRVIESQVLQNRMKGEPGGPGGNSKAVQNVTASATFELTIHQLGAVYAETAISTQAGSVFGDIADFAIKTAASDAMKRCAMNLGTQFGLSLYDNGSTYDVVRGTLGAGQTALERDWAAHERSVRDKPRIEVLTGTVPEPENMQSQPTAVPAGPLPEDELRGQTDEQAENAMPPQDAHAQVAGAFGGPQA